MVLTSDSDEVVYNVIRQIRDNNFSDFINFYGESLCLELIFLEK